MYCGTFVAQSAPDESARIVTGRSWRRLGRIWWALEASASDAREAICGGVARGRHKLTRRAGSTVGEMLRLKGPMPVAKPVIALLRCPSCGGSLSAASTEFVCQSGACGVHFPVVAGVPLLVGSAAGVYTADDFLSAAPGSGQGSAARSLGARVRAWTPSTRSDRTFVVNLRKLVALVGTIGADRPVTILSVGEAADAELLRSMLTGRTVEVIHVGTRPGTPHADVLCQPHRWPFHDGVADAVVLRRVLHRTLHVAEVAGEAFRVLRPGGALYAEEPFVEATHEGPDDFHRFTHLGLRGLFLNCEELGSGVAEGVGVALASSWRQVLWSVARSPYVAFVLATVGSWTSFFWKYVDRVLGSRGWVIDGAASVYFLGRQSEIPLSERELLAGYWGAAARGAPARPPERPASEVFTEWAATNRDRGMEVGHAAAVDEMLTAALAALDREQTYTAVDAGCGNGWIVRRLRESPRCVQAIGVDGSAGMIAKARALDPAGSYVIADLMRWEPPQAVDLVVSMEVLYYFDDPVALLARIATVWLRPGGYAVIGIDHYQENAPSLG
jgi:SAM-dependent methyltransferase